MKIRSLIKNMSGLFRSQLTLDDFFKQQQRATSYFSLFGKRKVTSRAAGETTALADPTG